MKQESFSDMEYKCRKKKTKREEFLEIMDEIIPWDEWVSLIVPHYPSGKRGRPPIEIETMLWHFGMKCHTGVDAGSGFVHTVEVTAANAHDITVASKLLREDDEVVYGDSAYLGVEKRDEIKNNPQLSAIKFRVNRRPGRLPKVSDNAIDWERYIENRKSSVRCKVEHPYRIVKNIFGFRKTVYRGLRKNLNRLHVLFASANLYMLARAGASLCPAQGLCAI